MLSTCEIETTTTYSSTRWCTATCQSHLLASLYDQPRPLIPQEAEVLFDAFGIPYSVMDKSDIEPVHQELLAANITLVQTAALKRVTTWLLRAPEPPAQDAVWPEHFSPAERSRVRTFVQYYLDRSKGAWDDDEPSSVLLAAMASEITLQKAQSSEVIRRVILQLKAEKRTKARKKRKSDETDEVDNESGLPPAHNCF